MPKEIYTYMQMEAEALSADGQNARARRLRRQTATYWEYGQANEARVLIRWAWHEFFKTYDALIAPIMATPAFEHDHQHFAFRTINVDGVPQPYFQQIFWTGVAVCACPPSAVVPAGLGADDLPVGVQIIGPEFGDLKTIGLAKLLEGAGFAFTPRLPVTADPFSALRRPRSGQPRRIADNPGVAAVSGRPMTRRCGRV